MATLQTDRKRDNSVKKDVDRSKLNSQRIGDTVHNRSGVKSGQSQTGSRLHTSSSSNSRPTQSNSRSTQSGGGSRQYVLPPRKSATGRRVQTATRASGNVGTLKTATSSTNGGIQTATPYYASMESQLKTAVSSNIGTIRHSVDNSMIKTRTESMVMRNNSGIKTNANELFILKQRR